MYMIPCEITIKYFIPAIRAKIAKILANEYNLKQTKIALKLGVTQAAVSKYLSGKYSEEIKRLEKEKVIKKISFELASKLAKDKNISYGEFCRYCKAIGRVKCEVI